MVAYVSPFRIFPRVTSFTKLYIHSIYHPNDGIPIRYMGVGEYHDINIIAANDSSSDHHHKFGNLNTHHDGNDYCEYDSPRKW